MSSLLTDHREVSLGFADLRPETEIRGLTADWEDALCSRNLTRLMAFYSREAVLFDVHPPFRVEGIEEIS